MSDLKRDYGLSMNREHPVLSCVYPLHGPSPIAFRFGKHANLGEFTPLRLFIDMEDVYSEFIMYI